MFKQEFPVSHDDNEMRSKTRRLYGLNVCNIQNISQIGGVNFGFSKDIFADCLENPCKVENIRCLHSELAVSALYQN